MNDISKQDSPNIVYLSMEYGISENLNIYAGGLGILSGDHMKTASDMGLNFTGIGLLYKQGYFKQRINSKGQQEALFMNLNRENVGNIVLDKNQKPLLIELDFPGRRVYAKVWKLEIENVSLFLLDSDVEKNKKKDREITSQLYAEGGSRELRLSQEIILGIGGVKLVQALNLKPDVWHINEGHSAFLILELIKNEMENNISFNDAVVKIKKRILFTTHTPVKEGNEVFGFDIIKKYLSNYIGCFNISEREFLEMGNSDNGNHNVFNMTIFSLKFSRRVNAVSKLNSRVIWNMWKNIRSIPENKRIKIEYITNGVHQHTWMADEINYLLKQNIGENWEKNADNKKIYKAINKVPGNVIWDIHNKLKENLIEYIKKKTEEFYKRNKIEANVISEIINEINLKKLTIGFARRFAAYKRANLLFLDEDKLKELLLNKEKPVQIIFAGKAHPADKTGQELLKTIYNFSLKKEFWGKILFLENYNIDIAHYLVEGVDVWLNTPQKPYEASGTSGQKAAMNGVLNCSILDGWWPEAYNRKNGWAIKDSRDSNANTQNIKDCRNLYSVLLNKVVPLYYNRKNNTPEKWIKMIKNSIITITPVYNTLRMVKEYYNKFYYPLSK